MSIEILKSFYTLKEQVILILYGGQTSGLLFSLQLKKFRRSSKQFVITCNSTSPFKLELN